VINRLCKDSGEAESKEVHTCSSKTIQDTKSLAEVQSETGYTEPIFPPALLHYEPLFLRIEASAVTWYQPVTLPQLLALKTSFPHAKLIVGNTEVGIEVKYKAMEYTVMINPSRIAELKTMEVGAEGVTIGSAVTINAFRDFIQETEKTMSKASTGYKARGLTAIHSMLSWFASNQIRNVACIGGNIVTACPISDLNPMLMALNAELRFRSEKGGLRTILIRDFFLAYRKVDIHPDEVLENVFIPFAAEFEFVVPLKQARRREDDISIVTSGMRIKLKPAGDSASWVVDSCSFALGGMAPVPVCAPLTAAAITGQPWCATTIEQAFPVLRNELSLTEGVPGGQAEYRMALTVSFLFKTFLAVTSQLQQYVEGIPSIPTDGSNGNGLPPVPIVDSRASSGSQNWITKPKPESHGQQDYHLRGKGSSSGSSNGSSGSSESKGESKSLEGLNRFYPPPVDPHKGLTGLQVGDSDKPLPPPPAYSATAPALVGQAVQHKNADAQVTGETQYTDDLPLPSNALHAVLVTSTKCHARLVSVDMSEAELCPGYVAYLSAKDVTGCNKIGAIVKDEEVFVTEEVHHYGAVLGVLLADTHEQAVYAARKVKVLYEDLPVVVSIEEAIAARSFFPDHHALTKGDLEQQKKEAEVVVSGRGRIGGQEHFYLETNCTVVLPSENDHLTVYSSTQNPTKTQNFCASVCGLPASKVVAKCKRMGGGFGGKETRSVFIAVTAALAAHLLNRPVSILIERDVDMSITGQRHAFVFDYTAGINKDGSLKFLDTHLYSNGGFSLDLSQPVLDRALFHADNVYQWPAMRVEGTICKTNQPTHTAFRGIARNERESG
jgi:xanthine dehydrogenase/oxidase